MPAQDVPNPQLPVVQRLRVRYAKRGRLRFTSHRDVGRAFERAVRRAGIPIAYSSGYSPHPRISYAGAAPTGSASEAEYLEIALNQRCDPGQVRDRLDAALPPGLDVVAVAEASGGGLADRLEASHWTLVLPGCEPRDAVDAVARFLSAESVQVQRMTKRGLRRFDARPAVVDMVVERPAPSPSEPSPSEATPAEPSPVATTAADGGRHDPCAILHLVIRHGTPSVRPDDVLAGLREVAGFESPLPPVQRRVLQGPFDLHAGTVGDPFAPDRDAPEG